MSRDGNLPLKAALVVIFSGLAVPLHAAERGATDGGSHHRAASRWPLQSGSRAVEVHRA